VQGMLVEDAAPRLGERKEAAGDPGDPLGHAHELRTQPGNARLVLVLPLHAQQVHGDHRQRVVDLVRDTGGQFSHRAIAVGLDDAADAGEAFAVIEASLDRLGVCNRLNLLLISRRRYDELIADGESVEYEKVLEAVLTRDGRDRSRAIAPLVKPEGAHEIDTTDMGIAEVTAELLRLLREHK